MEIEELIKMVVSLAPSEAIGPLRKILSIDGGAELLSRIVSSAVDPSVISKEDIVSEADEMRRSGDYGW